METINFNFPPTIAKRYVEQWKNKIANDEKADEKLKKVMDDVCTLCDVAIKCLQKENES